MDPRRRSAFLLASAHKTPEPEWGLMLNTLAPRSMSIRGSQPYRAMIFCGVDLLQPAQRRHAQRHGHQELTR